MKKRGDVSKEVKLHSFCLRVWGGRKGGEWGEGGMWEFFLSCFSVCIDASPKKGTTGPTGPNAAEFKAAEI